MTIEASAECDGLDAIGISSYWTKHKAFIHLKQHQRELMKEKYTEYFNVAQGL